MEYNWQQADWPEFTYVLGDEVENLLFEFTERVGRVSGLLEGLPEGIKIDTMVDILVSEAIKTSEIEGEFLSRRDVMSSIRNQLDLNLALENVRDQRAKGVGQLITVVRRDYSKKLTKKMLVDWHNMLMQGNRRVAIGSWRTHAEPMQIISGPIGREKIHFQAPPSAVVPDEMRRFVNWFNETVPGKPQAINKSPVRAAISHLYFESIHPFEDGNGRIGRAISEKALLQGIGRPALFSLSKAIETKRKAYYAALKSAQRFNDITAWIKYFVGVCLDAQIQTEELIQFTLKKTRFFDHFKDRLNERQLRVVQRILKEGAEGFEGGMSAKNYISITKISKATATRDLQDLVEKGVLKSFGGGRSSAYELALDVDVT
ncbi:MAG: cell division protein Fic [marine bacterium B5-7]|nr:MAG: cell division protein Fic [marine bacterium B5-7]